jgi:hypothetical protein
MKDEGGTSFIPHPSALIPTSVVRSRRHRWVSTTEVVSAPLLLSGTPNVIAIGYHWDIPMIGTRIAGCTSHSAERAVVGVGVPLRLYDGQVGGQRWQEHGRPGSHGASP